MNFDHLTFQNVLKLLTRCNVSKK